MYAIFASSSIFNAFFQSDFFGKLIFISLLSLSIISWIIMVNKIKMANKTKKNCFFFEKDFEKKKESLFNFDINPFSKILNPYFTIYSSVKQKTFELLNKNRYFTQVEDQEKIYLSRPDIELIESQICAIISFESKQLHKNLFVLSTIITLAPFLGLLGTVWGILVTFAGLQTDGITSANSAVLSGLSMALGTTVFGLVVAIPPLVGFNYLKNLIGNFSNEMELFSHKLITTLEIQYRRVDKK